MLLKFNLCKLFYKQKIYLWNCFLSEQHFLHLI